MSKNTRTQQARLDAQQSTQTRHILLPILEQPPSVQQWIEVGAAFNGTAEQREIIRAAIPRLQWTILGAKTFDPDAAGIVKELADRMAGHHIAAGFVDLIPGMRALGLETFYENGVGHAIYIWCQNPETIVAVLTQFWQVDFQRLLESTAIEPTTP